MADNVIANAGSGGATFAADDISGVHYPRSKLVWGADGTATDASAAAPLPVVQTGALPAGTAAIGKLAANSGVDIGDVDVTSLPALPAGANNIGDVDVLTLPRACRRDCKHWRRGYREHRRRRQQHRERGRSDPARLACRHEQHRGC